MSLMGTVQTKGPRATASTMTTRITAPTSARWWRRKRGQASVPSEARTRNPASAQTESAAVAALPEADTRVEPAIQKVRHQVEKDDQAREDEGHGHDHRGVVGQDGADQQRPDARNPENL